LEVPADGLLGTRPDRPDVHAALLRHAPGPDVVAEGEEVADHLRLAAALEGVDG
jgi:hypothetical protein